MIRIRYAELPAGLHVIAEVDRRGTVVYLLPGLTSAQRRAALGRVRSSARMGQGPGLPAVPMVVALAADRVRTNMHNASAAIWRHPALFLPPAVVLVSSAIVFTLMSFAPMSAAPHGTVPAGVPTLGIGARPSGAPSHHPTRTTKRHHAMGSASWARGHQLTASPALSPGSPVATSSPSPSPAPSQSGSAGGRCHRVNSRGRCVRA